MSLIPFTRGNFIKNWRSYDLYIHAFWDSRGNTSIHKKYDLFHLVIQIQHILFGSILLRFDKDITNSYKELVICIWIHHQWESYSWWRKQIWIGVLKFHDLTQYATSWGDRDLILIWKVSSRQIQFNLNCGKRIICDEAGVPHFSRPWEHSLLHECEAYIRIWGLYNHRKNTIQILAHSTES